mmetsp:Transcript_2325/g.3973  ORF Transcript_2325/g.3973 Transcript_2325/m.3973 type:complete len:755 (-) Transcript_2325:38-2302(-)
MIEYATLEANISTSTPLENQVQQFSLLLDFVNTSMAMIVAFLAVLCCQLIYSLMLSDVEEKTYEFGMLRALGFNRKNILYTIIVSALTFSVPGILTGLLVAAAFNAEMRYLLYMLVENKSGYGLTESSIIIGVTLGIVLPLFSNVVPIQKALGKNLRASLDVYHRSVGELTVSIKSLQEFGLSVNQFIVSILLVVLGICCYYVAPTAFLYQKLGLFFGVMNGLLLIMILGMTFISLLVLPFLQRLILNLFLLCFYKDRKLKKVILKNFQSHRNRNSKTAMMFSICLSFLIFAGSSFQLISKLLQSQLDNMFGADIYCWSFDTGGFSSMINDGEISQFLAQQQAEFGDVHDWTYVSFHLNDLLHKIKPRGASKVKISDYSGYKSIKSNAFSVQRNFLQTLDLTYYFPRELESDLKSQLSSLPNGDPDIIQALYSDFAIFNNSDGSLDPLELTVINYPAEEGKLNYTQQIKVVIPEGLRNPLSIDTTKEGRICTSRGSSCNLEYRMKVRSMVQKMPGFLFFTAYQSAQFNSLHLMTEQQYSQLLNDYLDTDSEAKRNYEQLLEGYNFTSGIPKFRLFVQLDPAISQERREFIANGIRAYFKFDTTVLLDKKVAEGAIQDSVLLFDVFVGVVGVIALILAFFLLLISTTQNIKENVWEYGCLRAIGLTKKQGMNVAMYEQYSLIIASLLLGSLVGLILAVTVTAQFFLFLEYPFELIFPEFLLFLMILMAIVTTYFAVSKPVTQVNNRQIAQVIKGV